MKETRADIRARQESRQTEKFPPDRIAFIKSAAIDDQIDLKKYRDGKMTFDQLRRSIAEHNLLDKVWVDGMIPERMMMHELKLLGWSKPYGI